MMAALSGQASAACAPAAPSAAAGSAIGMRFEALIAQDRFRDVAGNVGRWRAFIADAVRDPQATPEMIARARGWLGWSLGYVDKTDDALIAAREAERLSSGAGFARRAARAEILAILSMAETDLGKTEDAARHGAAALDQAQRTAGGDSAEASLAHNALGAVAYALGRYADAEREYGAATEIAVRCLAPTDPFIVNQMASHSGTLYMAGRAEEALAENERAAHWALTHLTEDNPVITLTLGNLGVMLRSAGRYPEAEATLRRVVDLEARYQKEIWTNRAISLSNFASVIDLQGRHEEAEALWLKSREFHIKAVNKRDPVTPAYPLRFAADAAQARGDLALALARRAEAIAVMAKDAAADHPELARTRIEYALNLALLHRADEALAIATPAIAIVQARLTESDTKRMTAEIAYARIVQAAQGAEPAYQLAAPIAARLEQKLLDSATGRRDLLRYGPAFSASFAAVTELALATHRDEAAFHALQLANLSDIVLVTSDVAARAAARDPASAALMRRMQDRLRERQLLDRGRSFAASSNQPTELARLDAAIAANDVAISAATTELDRVFPNFRALGRPVPIALADYRAGLDADQITLAPLPVADGTLAIAITREGLVWAKAPVGRSGVDALVSRIRTSIADGQRPGAGRPAFDIVAAATLYDVIVPGPLRRALTSHRALQYYASGPLASIPPGLLVTGPAPKTAWLVRSHAITVLATLAAPPAPLPRATRLSQAHFLGIGAPMLGAPEAAAAGGLFFRDAIDSSGVRALPPLPLALHELQLMKAVLGGKQAMLLTGAAATEAAVRALPLDRFDILAFATHGLVAGDFAGLSEPALVMTPPARSEGSDDGLLTASEIAGLRLEADWVILSACNTAGGGGGTPEYAGLTSAFVQAGARSLLVSHWPVRDDAAARLTVETVRGAQKGASRAVALQRAMLRLMDDRRLESAAHPAVWAPFVLIGRGR